MSYFLHDFKTHHGLDEPIDLAFRRIDQRDPSKVRLVSLVQGDTGEDAKSCYLAVASAHGKFTLACSI
jgi:hypothetical protein